jgi:hypothetical protein
MSFQTPLRDSRRSNFNSSLGSTWNHTPTERLYGAAVNTTTPSTSSSSKRSAPTPMTKLSPAEISQTFSPNTEIYQEQYDLIEKNSPISAKPKDLKIGSITKESFNLSKPQQVKNAIVQNQTKTQQNAKLGSEKDKNELHSMMSALFDDDEDNNYPTETPFRNDQTELDSPIREAQKPNVRFQSQPQNQKDLSFQARLSQASTFPAAPPKQVITANPPKPNAVSSSSMDKIVFQYQEEPEAAENMSFQSSLLNNSYSTMEPRNTSSNYFEVPTPSTTLSSVKPSILTSEFFAKNNIPIQNILKTSSPSANLNPMDGGGPMDNDTINHNKNNNNNNSSYHRKYQQILSSLLNEVDNLANQPDEEEGGGENEEFIDANNQRGIQQLQQLSSSFANNTNKRNNPNSLFGRLPLPLQTELQRKETQESLSLLRKSSQKYKNPMELEDPGQLMEKLLLLPLQDLQSMVLKQVTRHHEMTLLPLMMNILFSLIC